VRQDELADLAIERFSPQTALPNVGGSRTMTRFVLGIAAVVFLVLKFLFNIHFSDFGFGFWLCGHPERRAGVRTNAGAQRRHSGHPHADRYADAAAARDLLERWPIFRAATVRIVTVQEPATSWYGWLLPAAASPVQDIENVAAAMGREHAQGAERDRAKLRATGLDADVVMPEGDPGSMIVEAARVFGADAIVMGTRGRTGIERILLGSVARKVLQHASCSVLVTRAADAT